MARLSRPADSFRTQPVAHQPPNFTAGSDLVMSSPALRPLSPEPSLRSHGTDNLPHLPPRRGSELSSFSPTDCRTLGKLLRGTSINSPPPNPTLVGQDEKFSPNASCSVAETSIRTEGDKGYQSIGSEAADAGYKDDDDSMELSEGTEGASASGTFTSLNRPAIPLISIPDRRLQDSVSTHDEKNKLRYTGCHSSISKQSKARQREKGHNKIDKVTQNDTVKDIIDLPWKRAPSALPLNSRRTDSDRQPMLNDVKPLRQLRLSREKVLENECGEQKRHVELDEGTGVAVADLNVARDEFKEVEDFDSDEFDADKEDIVVQTPGTQRRKNLQDNAREFELQNSPAVSSSRNEEEARLLAPKASTAAVQSPDRAYIQVVAIESVPETPFTKTLSYYKQFRGTENTHSKRRRNTALPQEIVEVAEVAVDAEDKAGAPDKKKPQPMVPGTSNLPVTSALADLKEMLVPGCSQDTVNLPHHPVIERPSAFLEDTIGEGAADAEMTADETQKQLILY